MNKKLHFINDFYQKFNNQLIKIGLKRVNFDISQIKEGAPGVKYPGSYAVFKNDYDNGGKENINYLRRKIITTGSLSLTYLFLKTNGLEVAVNGFTRIKTFSIVF